MSPSIRFKMCLVVVLAVGGAHAAAQETGTLAKIRSAGSVTLGHSEQQIPFAYLNGGIPVGYSIDICLKIVEEIKVKLALPGLVTRYRATSGQSRIPSVVNSTIDLECGASTNTAERQQQVAFAPTTFVAATRLAWKKASNLKTLADLEGKTVAAQAGTTNLAVLNQINTQRGLKMVVKSFRTTVDLLSALDSGDVAAIASDDVLLQGVFAQTSSPQAYALFAEALSVEPYGMMYRKDDPAFKDVVQNAVAALMASGGLDRIYEKWFTQPIPPRGVSFAAPMDEMLKRAIARPTNSPDPADYR